MSVCAQHTVLVWVPTAFFLLTLPFLTAQCHLTAQRFDRLPFSAHFIIKLVSKCHFSLKIKLFVQILTAFLAVNSLFTWCYVIFSKESFAPAYYVYPGLWVIVWVSF